MKKRENAMTKKAVIFDMDGVIFDSERAVYQCWQEIAKAHHLTDLDTAYRKCIGVNSAMCRQIFMAHFGADFPYDDYTAEVSRKYHARYDHGRLPLKPGVRELLSSAAACTARGGLRHRGFFQRNPRGIFGRHAPDYGAGHDGAGR